MIKIFVNLHKVKLFIEHKKFEAMAYSKQGLIGSFSGQLGTVVVYEAFGKTIMRHKPRKRIKKVEGAQKRSQDEFARVMRLMQACRPFVKMGFSQLGGIAFHKAMSVNLNRYRQAENKDVLDWLLLSQGIRAGAENVAWRRHNQGKLLVSWGKALDGGSWRPDDQVMLMAINQQNLQTCFAQANRSQGQALLDAPPADHDQQLIVFLAFYYPLSELAGEMVPSGVSDSQIAQRI